MKLPIIETDDSKQMQTKWASVLEPLLSNPMLSGLTLKNVKLVSGSNTVNHTLARNLQGWIIVRRNSAATVYDTQDANVQKNKTLTLVASAAVTVDLFVY